VTRPDKVRIQADRIVINLDQEGVTITPNDIRDYMKRKPKEGLKEIIGIKDGKIVQIFP